MKKTIACQEEKMKPKLLMFDLEYHKKTHSSHFFRDFLEDNFDIVSYYEPIAQTQREDFQSIIDADNYAAVLFFQVTPLPDIAQKLRHPNLIYVPMYDTVFDWTKEHWQAYKNFKVVSFSKTISQLLLEMNFSVFPIQYYPEPMLFEPGNPDEVFFWQRVGYFGTHQVTKLIQPPKRLHLHAAIDPGHSGELPTEQEISDYKMTFTTWFETKEQVTEIIRQKGIYIAPRMLEGIGMSFLEAMSMGKAVVAFNRPTMNEYIRDGINGYLFSEHLKQIDFSNLAEIQKNAWNSVKEGREHYLETLSELPSFLLDA